MIISDWCITLDQAFIFALKIGSKIGKLHPYLADDFWVSHWLQKNNDPCSILLYKVVALKKKKQNICMIQLSLQANFEHTRINQKLTLSFMKQINHSVTVHENKNDLNLLYYIIT